MDVHRPMQLLHFSPVPSTHATAGKTFLSCMRKSWERSLQMIRDLPHIASSTAERHGVAVWPGQSPCGVKPWLQWTITLRGLGKFIGGLI